MRCSLVTSSSGMVELLTMLADRRLAREDPLLAELPVDTTDSGDMQLVRPDSELSPLSLLLWLWLTTLPPAPASFVTSSW